jgi:hypothetical protein
MADYCKQASCNRFVEVETELIDEIISIPYNKGKGSMDTDLFCKVVMM